MIRPAPERAITVIAWLLIIAGANSLTTAVANAVTHHPVTIPAGVPSLVLGFGLLARRAWAMKWSELGLVLTGLVAFGLSIATTFFNIAMPPTPLDGPPGLAGRYFEALFEGAIALLCYWAYKTLIRDDVRALARAVRVGGSAGTASSSPSSR